MRGTTSACAENTLNLTHTQIQIRNYLRVRGEYSILFLIYSSSRELPPRARRIRVRLVPSSKRTGTTSACAENTIARDAGVQPRRNYLRVRGEYQIVESPIMTTTELPPRARRIRGTCHGAFDALGTTSACAENTSFRQASTLPARNYLRVRGEYNASTHPRFPSRELPPRARRILFRDNPQLDSLGTTSACAENTPSGCPRRCARGNYLRVRGEYICIGYIIITDSELPPRARRILHDLVPVGGFSGTTSACAENTFQLLACGNRQGNYLRVRGEYRLQPG